MASVRNMLGAVNLRQSGIFLALVALVIVLQIWTQGKLLSPPNVSNLVLQYAYVLVLAIGMLFVIVVGHIDLSVGSVIALVGAIAATLVIKMQQPWWVAVLAGLAVGLLIGLWHGFWVAYVGIPGFIVTLSSMLLFRGATWMVLNSISLSPMSEEFKQIATGFVEGLFGKIPLFGQNVDVFTLLIGALAVAGFIVSALRTRAARIRYEQPVESVGIMIVKFVAVALAVMFFAFQLSVGRGFPIVLFILGALVLVYAFVAQNTIYGRHTYAIGGNIHAARLSGVDVKRTIMLVYVNMGLLAAIAGLIYSSRANGAQPTAGTGIELDAIAACFIGGAAVTGGVGRVVGAIIGGTIMAVMTNGMQLLSIESPTQQIVKGLVLLLAVAFDLINKQRAVSKSSRRRQGERPRDHWSRKPSLLRFSESRRSPSRRAGRPGQLHVGTERVVVRVVAHGERGARASSVGSTVALRYRLIPVPAGMSLPMMTFSFSPMSVSDLPSMAASVRTRVVSWKEAADSHDSVASDAFVIPISSGRPSAGLPPSVSA